MIINVGLYKTGLTSFRELFAGLGLRTPDWGEIDEFREAFDSRDPDLENLLASFECLSDIPVCYEAFLPSLVDAYPRATYVMSVRDPFKWLCSMKRHSFSKLMPGSNNITNVTLSNSGIPMRVEELQYDDANAAFVDCFEQRNRRFVDFYEERGIPLVVYDLDDPKKCDLLAAATGFRVTEFPTTNASGDQHLMEDFLSCQGWQWEDLQASVLSR